MMRECSLLSLKLFAIGLPRSAQMMRCVDRIWVIVIKMRMWLIRLIVSLKFYVWMLIVKLKWPKMWFRELMDLIC